MAKMDITRKKKQDIKKKKVQKTSKEQVNIVAHEIKFARLLSGNEKKHRDRALKALKNWLLKCFQKGYKFKEDDFMRIWKGLFYAVWMSDKPLVQEELCENISGILDQFPPDQYKPALMMTKVGLKAIATEWYGIDQHRMDKCLMLVRRYLRASLRCVARSGWSEAACRKYANMLAENDGIMAAKTPPYARNATSMILHIIDCYLEEIAKISNGDITELSLVELLRPFCIYMCLGEVQIICAACRQLLTALIRQSEHGLKYNEKAEAWQKMGCPEGGPDALEEMSDAEEDDDDDDERSEVDEDSERPLDPRAGRVHVTLTPLPLPSAPLAALLGTLRAKAPTTAMKRLNIVMQRFQALAKNEYPLKMDTLPLDANSHLPAPEQAAKSLVSLEKQLLATSDELSLRGLNRKHRKRLLAKSRSGVSIVEDATKLQHTSAAGDWQVEDTIPIKKIKKLSKEKKKAKKRKTNTLDDVTPKKPKIEPKIEKSTNKIKNTISTQPKENGIKKPKKTSKEKPTVLRINKTETMKPKIENTEEKTPKMKTVKQNTKPNIVSKKVKNFQKQLSTPKKVKFVLKNNSMQAPFDYYKSVRQSPNIPFDGKKAPSKTNLKPSTPSPINPFFKNKWKIN